VWNFVTQFARVCRDGWKSGTHTCYADVTSGTPAAWSAPPTSSAPPEVGPDDPNATPPPLMSVMTAGAVHPAQIVLADQVTALAKLAPDSGAADAPPPEIAKALHRAEQRPGIIRGTTIPAVTVSRTGVVNLNNGDFVSLAFSAAVAAPDFGTPGKSAAYGSRASSAVTFDLLLTLAGRPISYRNQLATLQAAVTAPLTGTSPTITIETTALGTQSNKTIRYAGKERALHYSEVRRQQVREDLCALSESVPLAQGVDIDLKLACPALFGYALVVDAVPKQASVQMAPIANVGMELSADVSAAGGLLTIGAITDADLITAQARVGAYANFVADPNPVGPTASRADRFIALRPYEFATVKAGDGFIYIVLKAAGTTTYIKVYEWDPLYRADLDDGGSLSVYRLTRP
jgi:hypothetical protein